MAGSNSRSVDAAAAGRRLVDALVRRLGLERLDGDRFAGTMPRGDGFVFGGLLLAQGLMAAGRTIDATPHALHAQFLRGGRYGTDVDWQVTRLRDGFNFATRRADASQGGRLVVTLTVSFVRRAGDGLSHQDAMPPAAAPDSLEDWEELRVRILNDPQARRADGPLEVRDADPDEAAPAVGRAARRRLWMRPRAPLPDDPLVHAAMLAFASDRGLLSTAARPHGLMWGARQGASLDHALWLHAPARFDDWVLYASESPVAAAGRGLVLGAMYARDGRRIASSAQEGLIRVRP